MKEKLLLHSCCAPCSSAILEHLANYYDITLYFYNPNITDLMEYNRRADELVRLVNDMELSNVNVVICEFDPEEFYKFTSGLEGEPEGGRRCKSCYANRLNVTALYAKQEGYTQFSTTLTISPYKDSSVINGIGTMIGNRVGVMYMPFDFSFLYIRSLDLCEEYGLYQQDYCGCEYSKGH